MNVENLEKTLVGVAGEYLVAGELTLRGIVAAITLRNSRGIDIVASSADGTLSRTIQVKTNSRTSTTWILGSKSEDFASPGHFYVFVQLQGLKTRPDYYIVPSEVVAETVRTSHAKWISGKKRDGSPRRDSSLRKFRDTEGLYLEKWDLLGF